MLFRSVSQSRYWGYISLAYQVADRLSALLDKSEFSEYSYLETEEVSDEDCEEPPQEDPAVEEFASYEVVARGVGLHQAAHLLGEGRYIVKESWLQSKELQKTQGIPSQDFTVEDITHSDWAVIQVYPREAPASPCQGHKLVNSKVGAVTGNAPTQETAALRKLVELLDRKSLGMSLGQLKNLKYLFAVIPLIDKGRAIAKHHWKGKYVIQHKGHYYLVEIQGSNTHISPYKFSLQDTLKPVWKVL